MKKFQFLSADRHCGHRLLAALLFCLAAGWSGTSLFAENGAVVLNSPLGTSRLGWVKPKSAALKPEALPFDSAESDLFFTDDDAKTEKSSIRQVRALENPSEKPAVSPAPVAVAMTDDDTPSAARAASEKRLSTLYADECPDPHKLASIKDMGYKIVASQGEFPESCPLPDEVYTRKLPTPIVFTWKASALCHKPLYFEDVQLERYGHTFCPILQPAISGARFWLTIPILPYLMGTYPPNECVYDLGYYRPGSCAPNMLQPLPISLRGGLIEAGAVVGAAAAIP